MSEQKFVTPLKVGLLIVAIAYFLFTLHATFVLSWIGEWEYIGANNPQVASWIFITDISAYVFLIFRFIASIITVSAVILYFIKKGLPPATTNKLLRAVLVFEGLYWIGLLPSGIWGISPTQGEFNTSLLLTTGIPCLVSSIGISVSLFILAYKLNPKRPIKEPLKWAYIAGILYVLSFWLSNSGMWMTTIIDKGTGYLFSYPEAMVSSVLTIAGLLTLALFTTYYAGKSANIQQMEELELRPIGAILLSLGLYFLWNYLTWIFFGGWNEWYAWFLGHNLDLWLLSLPLVGLPLLFHKKNRHSLNN
ncbi:MAG: hypothetical protein M1540_05865 [Candidatus Bathyarchaeota archaeon]|nr:hypothetical protein [Candidatus Bathyarchaeota archaeon]